MAVVAWMLSMNSAKALEGGLGVCHYDGADGLNMGSEVVNWFYWGGGPFDWAKIEATKGMYDFSASEQLLSSLFAKRPKVEYWVDVQTALVPSVPEWAKNDYYGYQPYGTSTKRSFFIPWNENYLNELDKLLGQVRRHFDNPNTVVYKNRDKMVAINIMGGGPNGEMMTGGFPADQRERIGYTDEKYYEALMRIVEMYVKHFGGFKPVVLQLGSGAYGRPDFMKKVAEDVVARWGNQVWLKYNGWSEAINAELVTYPWMSGGYWRKVGGDSVSFRFTNTKARNIRYGKVKIKANSGTVNRNLKMVIYKDSNGKVGEKWAESELVVTSLSSDPKTITFTFPSSPIYLSYTYWAAIEGFSLGELQVEVVQDSSAVLGDRLGGWTYFPGERINWELTQVFKEGLGTHRLLASLAGKTRVGFEPGNFGLGTQAYPVQNSAEVIYNSIMETVNPNWVSKYPSQSTGRSDFYVPISYLCLQNDYYARSGISRDQFAGAANYIRANAAKSVGAAVTPTATTRQLVDANNDGITDLADLAIWKLEYLSQNGNEADFNDDGGVNLTDLGIWKIEYLL